jgi:hypothetical protein
MDKSIIIENPQLELSLLQELAALDGNSQKVSLEDYSANVPKAQELINRLQGTALYWNDNCPWHESIITFYDMNHARNAMERIRSAIGDTAFANSKIVFEELFLGMDFRTVPELKALIENLATNEPPHHIIVRTYPIPKNGSVSVRSSLSSLPKRAQEIILNLQYYNDANTLISWVIKNPDKELRLLREIAALDRDEASISDADMRHSLYQQKLSQLEGHRLYTNDPGTDATRADLNGAYTALKSLNVRYDLASSDVLFTEKFTVEEEGARRVIDGAHIILNEEAGYARVRNFVQD